MKYYCIGIKGTGMSTLAQILFDLGNEVSGYDDAVDYKFTQKGLEERNIPIYYDDNHELDKDTIVTYSVAFSLDHPELRRMKEKGYMIKKYSQIVGDVVKMFETISVAGTHGKTTTSSLIRHILHNTLGCSYFVGAGDGFVDLKRPYFVIESDEYNKHFLDYYPKYSIITNMEKEHMECYEDLDDIIYSFSQFANQTDKFVVACGDNENVRKLTTNTKVYYYGFQEDNDVIIRNIELTDMGSIFDIYIGEEKLGHFDVPLYGNHMILNATAAIFMCYKLGVEIEKIRRLLASFQNAPRRFVEEVVGNTIIVDDYAHHPTEIRATLEAARQKYPNRKIVAVFRPNTYSRLKDFANDFIESLKVADKVYVTEVVSNRERQEDYSNITSKVLTDKIDNSQIIENDEDISKLKSEKGNVVCFMGCISVNHLIDNFKNSI